MQSKIAAESLDEGLGLLEDGCEQLSFPRSLKVQDYGAMIIGKALRQNETCVSLDLQYNGIEDIGFYYLARGLITNKVLSSLNLSRNRIVLAETVAMKEPRNTGKKQLYATYGSEKDLLEASANLEIQSRSSIADFYFSESENESATESNSVDGLKSTNKSDNTNGSRTSLCTESSKSLKKTQPKEPKNLNFRALLINVMRQNSSLKVLDLSHNSISESGANTLGAILKKNNTLEHLDLKMNKIGHKGANYIAMGLESNSCLKTLTLDMAKIEDTGVQALSDSLKKNKTLESLSLRNNYITGEGAVYLSELLKENHSLSVLNLTNNDIDVEGAIAISQSLGVSSLESLDLSVNDIKTEGFIHIMRSLFDNASLKNLVVEKNSINLEHKDVVSVLEEYAARNKILERLQLTRNIGSSFAVDSALALIQANADPPFTVLESEGETNVVWSKGAWNLVENSKGPGALILVVALQQMVKRGYDSSVLRSAVHARNEKGSSIVEAAIETGGNHWFNLVKYFYELGFNLFEETDKEQRKFIDVLKSHEDKDIAFWAKSLSRNSQKRNSSSSSKSVFSKMIFKDSDSVTGKEKRHKLFSERFEQLPGPMLYQSDTSLVFMARDVDSQKEVVIKIMLDRDNYENEMKARILLEKNIEGDYSKYVVPGEFPDAEIEEIDDPDKYVILSSRGISLYDSIHSNNFTGKDIEKVREIAFQAAKALEFLNRNGIVHGDFSPSNFVNVGSEDAAIWNLIDLDTSCKHGNVYRGNGVVTAYSPPELARSLLDSEKKRESIHRGEHFSQKFLRANETIDVWSFGAVLYEMATGSSLFGKNHIFLSEKLYSKQALVKLLQWDNRMSEEMFLGVFSDADTSNNPNMTVDEIKIAIDAFKDLLSVCLDGNPANRFDFKSILKHPFFIDSKGVIQSKNQLSPTVKKSSKGVKQRPRVSWKPLSKETLNKLRSVDVEEKRKERSERSGNRVKNLINMFGKN